MSFWSETTEHIPVLTMLWSSTTSTRIFLKVISSKLVAGIPEIHVFSDNAPDDSFMPVDVDLEDVFFSQVLKTKN